MGGITIKASFLILAIGLFGCAMDMDSQSTVVDLITTFDFEQDDQAWEGGISDYPADYEGSADFIFKSIVTPSNLVLEGNGLSISADNPHGDLFYYFKRETSGLSPGKKYKVDFEFLVYAQLLTQSDILSDEDLYLKIGAVNYKPELKPFTRQNSIDYIALNVDKGTINSESGTDLVKIGSIKEFTSDVPEDIFGNTSDSQIEVEANADGAIWIVIGVDSGVKSELTFGLAALTVYYREQN